MAEILLLRHAATSGNQEGRYIGKRTDEPLCPEGRRLLYAGMYPPVERIYVSPMRRCIETASILWPGQAERLLSVPGLMECDFGNFENKNYKELSGNPAYQAWIDSGGTLPFPGGESMEQFKARCREAFSRIAAEIRKARIRAAVVVHGGTVMTVLERYGLPHKSYFDYQVKNGRGYLLTPVEGTDLWNCQYLQL